MRTPLVADAPAGIEPVETPVGSEPVPNGAGKPANAAENAVTFPPPESSADTAEYTGTPGWVSNSWANRSASAGPSVPLSSRPPV